MATDQTVDPSSGRAELAALLRAWRTRVLLTQEQLAERTGLSVRTIGRMEAGRLRPRSESVRLLADALELSEAERQMLAVAVQGRPAPAATPAAPVAPVPRQLPADVAGFTGRSPHLAELDGLLAGDGEPPVVLISAIAGAAGVGKTALAVHWAHQVSDRFPDGQLHVNLQGYAAGPPVEPLRALAQLLQSLGVEAEKVPVELDAAAATYRSLLSGRRVLVVLDNARDATQVRPLLPGSPRCVVVVTSRDRLTGLVASHGAHRLLLDVLAPDEAVGLLARILGQERVDADPGGTVELAEACGRLPLALRIAAANLAGEPERSIGSYAGALRGDRLGGLAVEDDPEVGVRAAFDHSYAVLHPDAQRLFRLLGLVPGPEVTPDAAAALAGTAPDAAARLLGRLAAAHLLEVHAPDRYGLHDLLRLYASQRAEMEDSSAERQAAVRRLLDWYLHTADSAAQLLYPYVVRLPLPSFDEGPAAGLETQGDALAWLDAERANLIAAVTHAASHGPKRHAWLLADTLRGYLTLRWSTVDWLAVAQAALAAATDEGNPRAQAAAQLSLGLAQWNLGNYPQAIQHFTASQELALRAGWVDGQAAAFGNLGMIRGDMGSLEEAADLYAQSLALYQQTGRLVGQAIALGNLGAINRALGRLQQSVQFQTQVLALGGQAGSSVDMASALSNLGEVSHDLGRLGDARRHLTEGLSLHRQGGNRYGEVYSLYALAAVHRDAGQWEQALDLAQTAVALAREIGDRRTEADALSTLGSVHLAGGDAQQAADTYRQSMALASQIDASYPVAVALLGLAAAHLALGRGDRALEEGERALAIADDASYRVLEGQAHTILASAHLARGRDDLAGEHARRALDLHRATGHRLGEARTLVILGQVLRRDRDGDAASVASWREALALFTDIGSPEAEATRALLQQPPTSSKSPEAVRPD